MNKIFDSAYLNPIINAFNFISKNHLLLLFPKMHSWIWLLMNLKTLEQDINGFLQNQAYPFLVTNLKQYQSTGDKKEPYLQ